MQTQLIHQPRHVWYPRALQRYELHWDFENAADGPVDLDTSGVGSSNTNSTGGNRRPGTVEHSTGPDSAGAAGWWTGTSAYEFGDIVFQLWIGFALGTLSDGTDRYVLRVGFNDGFGTDGEDGAFFRYSDDVNSGKWEAVTRSNSVESTADTGVTAATGRYYNLGVQVTQATRADFYVVTLGVFSHVATLTTNIPTGTGRSTAIGATIRKTLGTTARTFVTDYVDCVGDMIAPRQ